MIELEHLLSKPSSDNWGKIVKNLDATTDNALLEEKLAFCKIRLENWPDDLKLAPGDWYASHDPRIQLTKLIHVATLPSESEQLIDSYLSFSIKSLAYLESLNSLVLAGDDYENHYAFWVSIESNQITASYTWKKKPSNQGELRCERLMAFGEDRYVLGVFSSSGTMGPDRARIELWKEQVNIFTIEEPPGDEAPDTLNEIVTYVDEQNARLYYWFWSEKTLKLLDISSLEVIASRKIEDVTGLAISPSGNLVISDRFAQFQICHSRSLRSIESTYGQELIRFPAISSTFSTDSSIFCTVHPIDFDFADMEDDSPFTYGGIIYWGNFELKKMEELFSFPFPENPYAFSDFVSFTKASRLENDVYTAAVIHHKLYVDAKGPVSGQAQVSVALINKSGVQDTLILHKGSKVGESGLCINTHDGSSKILLGVGKEVFQWIRS